MKGLDKLTAEETRIVSAMNAAVQREIAHAEAKGARPDSILDALDVCCDQMRRDYRRALVFRFVSDATREGLPVVGLEDIVDRAAEVGWQCGHSLAEILLNTLVRHGQLVRAVPGWSLAPHAAPASPRLPPAVLAYLESEDQDPALLRAARAAAGVPEPTARPRFLSLAGLSPELSGDST